MDLLIKNGFVLQSNGSFLRGHIGIDRGKIAALWYSGNPSSCVCDSEIDAGDYFVSPGLIDTHIHGGNGFNFSLEGGSGWEKLEERLTSTGVTSVLPTGTSLPPDETLKFIDRIAALKEKNDSNRVEILGAQMEGPYINKNKKGAHLEEYIRPADPVEIERILDRGLVRIWAMAPEIEENMAAVKIIAAAGVSVSLAHTDADYNAAMNAFSAGANRVTHTFNAMPPLNQRYQGIVTAAWQHGAFMELIADGHHVSQTIMKMFVAATDPGKIVLVSDNNEFSGFKEGTYFRNNRRLTIEDGQLKTESGSLAGSIAGLNQIALNLTRCGFSPAAALRTVTENPARSAGVFERKGSIALGKDADIVILDARFEPVITIKAGRIVYESNRFPMAVRGG